MRLTLIFIYRDKEIERVRNTFGSLALQDDPDFNVILVDYGSSDLYRTQAETLCKDYSFCKYLYIDTQGKFWNRAEALNYGILKCETEWIFTADVDLVFKTDFVSQLRKEISENEAKFFSVGYLDRTQTEQLDLKEINTLSYKKSEDFALGMVLVSKQNMVKVNGYNSFYAIWGMEDTDIKARFEKLGIKTSFIHDVLMLHQYHEPASTIEGGMPKGWIQYSKDHFAANGIVIGMDTLTYPPKRPAKEYQTKKSFISKNISGRILFIRDQLINYIVNSPEKELILVIDTASHQMPQGSNTSALINFTNSVLKLVGVNANVSSDFKEQYVTPREIRDEIYFIVKSLSSKIADHFIEESANEIKLIIVKP